MPNDPTTESIFVPPPVTPQPAAPRVTGRFFGVDIPEDIAVFDSRWGEETTTEQIKAPWGEVFYSHALLALGLATGYLDSCGPTPASINVYYDTRKPECAESTRASLLRAIERYREIESLYNQHKGMYKPACIEVENFGFDIHGDRRYFQ